MDDNRGHCNASTANNNTKKNAHFNTWLSTFPFSVCAWIFLLLFNVYENIYNG